MIKNVMSAKKISKLLEEKGWFLLKIQGFHHVYSKRGKSEKISLPMFKGVDIKEGLSEAILKAAGCETLSPKG